MKITVKSRSRWRRVTFNVPDDTFERIRKLAKRYGFRMDEVLRIILLHGYINHTENAEDPEKLEAEISELERELYELEGKWSPLKFKTYYLALDNQNLGIQLSGMIAENRRLRKMLGKPERDFSEVERLIRYYLSFKDKD
jgi:small-conductance mechanosensitive channel